MKVVWTSKLKRRWMGRRGEVAPLCRVDVYEVQLAGSMRG